MRKIINRLTSWYFSKGALPYWIILLIDCVIVSFAGYAAFYMQWGGGEFTSHFWQQTRGILIAEVVFIIFFRIFHTYSSVMRYSSVMDLVRVIEANLCATVVTFLLGIFFISMGWKNICFPGALGCIELFCITTMLMWIERVLTRLLYDSVIRNARARRAFIYGVKESGVAVAKSLQNETPQHFKVVGFVSPEGDLQTKWLMGVQVRKDGPNLIKHMKSAHAHVLIVSPNLEEQFSSNTELVDQLIDARVTIMMFPKIEDWEHNEKPDQKQLHEVHIEDLLPRDKIEVDMDAIVSMLKNKCILITGAAGSIGSEMVRQIAPYQPSHLVLIDQAETPMHDVRMFMHKEYAYIPCNTIVTSITNKQHMERIFAYYKPEYVFHAAAYKHVPMMEDNPAIAVQNNIYGTRVIADLAVKYGTKKFVMISTDKAVNPTNVMGCSKRICEIYCQSLNREIEKLNNPAPQPLTPSDSQPLSDLAPQRLGVSAPQPLSDPASQPLSDLATQHLSISASRSLSLSAPQRLSLSASQRLSISAPQRPSLSASQQLSPSAPQQPSLSASQQPSPSASQPLSSSAPQQPSFSASQQLSISATSAKQRSFADNSVRHHPLR